MRTVRRHYRMILFPTICSLAFILLITIAPQTALAQISRNDLALISRQIAVDFETRAKEYSALRGRLERQLPKLPQKATPEQIQVHKVSLQKAVQAARNGERRGRLFTAPAAAMMRRTIRELFQGKDRVELRKTVFEAETAGVPVRVNATYPESKELIEMPTTLLFALPQLPPELRYRFVGRNLLLVDRDGALIIDYMTNALP